MNRRTNEPDEALGPAVDGLEAIKSGELLPAAVMEEPVAEAELEPEPQSGPAPVMLVCGADERSRAACELAAACGFDIMQARLPDEEMLPAAKIVDVDGDLENFVQACGIDRDSFICLFWSEDYLCESALAQCLASEAAYIGLWASRERRDEIFSCLREDGAPHAELAAICSPMGLNIGASDPQQEAVAIVAELLAARAGSLKRLRHED